MDKRCGTVQCSHIGRTCSGAAHASGWPLCECATASSTFYVWERPWAGYESMFSHKNNVSVIRESEIGTNLTIFDLAILDLQLIQRAPIRFGFGILRMSLHFRCFANTPSVAVATRVGRQIQKNVLAHERRDIDRLGPMQFGVERESRHLDFVFELIETGNAAHFHLLGNRSISPERPIGYAKIETIMHRRDATNFLRRQIAERTIFVTRKVQTLRWDLIQMNFHSRSRGQSISIA